MKKCFYDKECTKEIKCFYDPCYRTGDFYSRNYIYDSFEGGDISDSLFNIVKRCDKLNQKLWCISSSGKEVCFEFILLIHTYNGENKNGLIVFKDSSGIFKIYNSDGYDTLKTLEYTKEGFNIKNLSSDKVDPHLFRLINYSFTEKFKDKDNEICPELYANVPPMSEEEKDIVKKRITEDPYYKSDSYK